MTLTIRIHRTCMRTRWHLALCAAALARAQARIEAMRRAGR